LFYFKEVELLFIKEAIISHEIFGLLLDFFDDELSGDCTLDLAERPDSFTDEIGRGVFLVLVFEVESWLVFARA
jgi:hypothetical protein